MNMEGDFLRLTVVLSIVSLLGIIPAFWLGHWLLFLGGAGAFVGMIWAGFYGVRWIEKLYRKYGGSEDS